MLTYSGKGWRRPKERKTCYFIRSEKLFSVNGRNGYAGNPGFSFRKFSILKDSIYWSRGVYNL
jgi:hypothetical protein